MGVHKGRDHEVVCVMGKSTFGCNQLPLKSLNRFSWRLEEVSDVGWVMVT